MSKTKSQNALKLWLIRLGLVLWIVEWFAHQAVEAIIQLLLLPLRVLREPFWLVLKPFIREWKHK